MCIIKMFMKLQETFLKLMQAAAAISVPRFDDLALIHTQNGLLLSQITHLEKEIVTLQVYGGDERAIYRCFSYLSWPSDESNLFP